MKPVSDVLYIVSASAADRIRDEMTAAGGRAQRGPRGDDWMVVSATGRTCQFNVVHSVDDAIACLPDHYYNFVVVDARGPSSGVAADDALAQRFIHRIHFAADPDLRYPLSRIVAVLEPGPRVADQAFAIGRQRIGGFVLDPFTGTLFDKFEQLHDPDPGKVAICLSGGGVEGFLFEVGVMKALNAHLQARSVTDVDIFCGISAGAILASFLANGTEPEEVDLAVTDPKAAGNLEAVTPGVVYDPHFKEYASRVWSLGKSLAGLGLGEAVSSALRTVPVGFFRGEALQRFVERQLEQPGRTNDFRELTRELYIGATDQDTSTHVVFGDGQWRDIPISTAVRASTALTPFYEPAKIRGRYFVDGQYTRTSNFHLAIERGAKLVIIIDPLVPVRVDLPGYVRKKGGVYAALQALKAVIHTRFLHGFQSAADAYPNVDFVLFTPEGNAMRLMSGSPMKYNIRTEILNMAYRYGVRRIQRDFEILRGIFAKHGFELQRHPRLRSPHRKVI